MSRKEGIPRRPGLVGGGCESSRRAGRVLFWTAWLRGCATPALQPRFGPPFNGSRFPKASDSLRPASCVGRRAVGWPGSLLTAPPSAGRDGEHAAEVQVPRHLRQLPAQDLLAGDTGVPRCGGAAAQPLPPRHTHQAAQPQQRPAGAGPRGGSLSGPGRSRATPPGQPCRPGLFREVARLLRARAAPGLGGHRGPPVQQEQRGPRRLWQHVLWSGPQHPAPDTQRALPLPLPLVLLRGL